MDNRIVSPVRWVGGKRAIVEQIMTFVPDRIGKYAEPFLGGGTVFVQILSERCADEYHLNDINPHLINMWQAIRDATEELKDLLVHFKEEYDPLPDMDHKRSKYYEFRGEFNSSPLSVRHAALFMTLNKTCFNALTRYNSKGHFNSAFGKRVQIALELDNISRLGEAMKNAEIRFSIGDFDLPHEWREGDFVYLDPPYHPLGDRKMDDTTYTKSGFWTDDEKRLRKFCDRIASGGGRFLLSNHECPAILDYFGGYPYERVTSYKSYTGKASSRMKTTEILLGNHLPPMTSMASPPRA